MFASYGMFKRIPEFLKAQMKRIQLGSESTTTCSYEECKIPSAVFCKTCCLTLCEAHSVNDSYCYHLESHTCQELMPWNWKQFQTRKKEKASVKEKFDAEKSTRICFHHFDKMFSK